MRRLVAATAILAAFAVHGATVGTAKFGDIGMDDNVVTNATFDGLAAADSVLPARKDQASEDRYVDVYTHFTASTEFESPCIYFRNGLFFGGAESYSLSEHGIGFPGGFAMWPLGVGMIALTNDIPPAVSNVVTKAYVESLGISAETDLSEYAKLYTVEAVSNKVETTAAIVDSWEGYWGATNVELQVTNFYGNTSGALPRLRIREYRDGHWTNVWDEVDKFIACKAEILHDVAQSNETVLAAVEAKYAPKAWGAYTDKGTTNVIPNSVYMSSPETYFGGGTEFQRVAVGSGAVSVLVDRGALAKTTGEPGTFRFQDAGGTNYFGFVKSDSYTIGCRTDGISVGAGNAITLRYDVIMSGEDVPVVYWKQQLESATPWAQLNNTDGTAADGAPYVVTWLQDGGSYYATVNCGGSPSGFFVAETSVAGDVVWETNMKARLGGGIECTNTATHVNGVIRAKYNGSTVTWEWSAR